MGIGGVFIHNLGLTIEPNPLGQGYRTIKMKTLVIKWLFYMELYNLTHW